MSHDAKTLSETRTYYLKEGDRAPVLELVLYNEDGTIKDLSGFDEANLVVAKVPGGRRLLDGTMTIEDGEEDEGIVTYEWEEDELVAGEYLMEVILDRGAAAQESWPKSSYYKLTIMPRL